MIHQHRRWKMVATVKLWKSPLIMANDTINESQSLQKKDGHSPFKIFSNTEVQPKTKHCITFGCPVYVLVTALQSGRGIHKKW